MREFQGVYKADNCLLQSSRLLIYDGVLYLQNHVSIGVLNKYTTMRVRTLSVQRLYDITEIFSKRNET